MSRVGNAIIEIPAGVEINRADRAIEVKGPKGVLNFEVSSDIDVAIDGNKMTVSRQKNDGETRSLHGLTRAILNNMVIGVTKGWVKNLEMIGVGYRAQGGGEQLTLSVGYSHPVIIKAPQGIALAVTENTKLSVSGIDRQLVGQVAANIRSVRPPEPYKGKGIRYSGEYVRRKAGKAGKGAAK
jgi:large subunit ribosomal protein L6